MAGCGCTASARASAHVDYPDCVETGPRPLHDGQRTHLLQHGRLSTRTWSASVHAPTPTRYTPAPNSNSLTSFASFFSSSLNDLSISRDRASAAGSALAGEDVQEPMAWSERRDGKVGERVERLKVPGSDASRSTTVEPSKDGVCHCLCVEEERKSGRMEEREGEGQSVRPKRGVECEGVG